MENCNFIICNKSGGGDALVSAVLTVDNSNNSRSQQVKVNFSRPSSELTGNNHFSTF